MMCYYLNVNFRAKRVNLKALRLLGIKERLYSSELVEIRLTMRSVKLLKHCVVIMIVTVIALGSADSTRILSPVV